MRMKQILRRPARVLRDRPQPGNGIKTNAVQQNEQSQGGQGSFERRDGEQILRRYVPQNDEATVRKDFSLFTSHLSLFHLT